MNDKTPPDWTYAALLDALYLPDVLALVRERPGEVQTFREGHWQPLQDVADAVEPGHPWVKRPLSDAQVADVLAQAAPSLVPPTLKAAAERIRDDLTAMSGTGGCRSISFGGGVWAQWACWLDGYLTVELPGDPVLPSMRQLTPQGEGWLLSHGAAPPDAKSPNWVWRIHAHSPLEVHLVGHYVVKALAEVYGIPEVTVAAAVLERVPSHG